MDNSLKNKAIAVPRGASGIDYETVKLLAAAGACIMLVDWAFICSWSWMVA